MPVIVRKISRFAGSLAALCMTVFLCVMPITAAQAEEAEGGQNAAPTAKKKIALLQFDVANPLHVDDINNIYDGLPSMLAQRLEASGEFLAVYTGRSIPPEAGEAQREAVVQVAGENGAQFLISGMVVNAGTKQEKGYLGTPIGRSTKRHIEVEFAVHDALTGARLLTRRLDEEAQGEVKVGNDKPFGSSAFLETEFGQALNRLLDAAVRDIRAALRSVPFSANIVRIEGNRVFIDAGSDALLKPGDRLVAYVGDAAPVVGLKGAVLGLTGRVADTVTLTQVRPQFSIGELPEDATKHGIRAGHIARIDPAGERELAARQMAEQQAARARQAAREEAERSAREQAVQAQAQLMKAEQAAKAEATRIKAEKEAKAQADAEAKAARLKSAKEASAGRLSAAQEARAREEAQAARAAARAKREADRAEKKAQAEAKAKAAAEAKAARLKAKQEAKAEAARIKAEKEAQAKAEKEAKAKEPAAAETKAGAFPKSAKAKTKQKPPARMEVRAVAVEDLEREAAEAKKAGAASGVPPEQKKPGVPLKLKQIRP